MMRIFFIALCNAVSVSILCAQVTVPSVVTGSATAITSTSATLNGSVMPNGAKTTALFEYGLTAGYGSVSPTDTIDDHPSDLLFHAADSSEVVIPSGIDLSNKSFSIEFWAKVYPTGNSKYIIGQGPATARRNSDLHIGFDNSTDFRFGFYDYDLSAPVQSDTLWHHWAVVATDWGLGVGGDRYIYRDGSLIAHDESDGFSNLSYIGTGQILIGNCTFASDYFDGYVSDVRIWSVALDSSTIQSWMYRRITSSHPYYADLLGYWELNEDAGTVAGDSSGHGYDGSIKKATWESSAWTAPIQYSLAGLPSSTTYHYRLVASNSAGTTHGPDSTFTTLLSAPTVQASNVTFSNVTEHSALISWTNGNGQARLVVVRTGTNVDNSNVPESPTIYSADTVYGAGSSLGTNGYVLYLGASNSVGISGLLSGQTYIATVYEVNNPTTVPEYDTISHPTATVLTGTQSTFIPTAVTGVATSITNVTATLNGNITTEGSQTIVYFNYGSTTGYGSVSTKDTVDDQENALLFNAADSDDVICNGSNYLLFTEFTVEAWAKRYPNGKYNTILSAGYAHQNSALQFGFRDSASGNVFTFGFYNDDLNTPHGYTDTLWHQWVGVLGSGYNRYLYRDGVLVAHDVAAEFYPNPSQVIIGRDVYDNTSYFNGKIANVRMWNTALDSTTIRNWMYRHITPSHPYYGNCIAEWRLNEGSGVMAGDSSGNGDNGRIYSATWTNGTNSDLLDISSGITGLTPQSTHHYRIVAINSSGPTIGSDMTFFSGAPTVQASDIIVSGIAKTSLTLKWTIGNGESRLVLMKRNTSIGSDLPIDGTIYTASSTFGIGSQIGSGVYVVCVGTGDSVTVSGLAPGDYYTAAVFEMNNSSTSPTYLTSSPPTIVQATVTRNYSTEPGTALSFKGSGYLNAGDSTSFNFTGSFTVEGWVKVDSFTTDWQAIITKGDNAWRVQRYGSTNNLDFGTSGLSSQDMQGSVNVNDGNWHFVAAVYDGSSKTLYVDGRVDAESAVTGTLGADSSPLYIGENADNTGRTFHGSMDEIRLWKVVRTEQQIRTDMFATTSGAQDGLLDYWQFNEGSGSTSADSVSGNNATINGSLSWVTSDAPVGSYGSYDAANSADSAGLSGFIVSATLSSPADSIDFLGLYSYGSATDTAITSETFPSGVTKCGPVIWGIYAVGNDTANVTLDYSGLSGIQNESSLKVLEREEADSPWVDVTSNFTQNVINHTFSELGVRTFSQFAIGAGTDNALAVELSSFKGTSAVDNVTLSWQTATEVDNAGFNVLRKDPNASAFAVIASFRNDRRLRGAGTSSTLKLYNFADDAVHSGATYSYKLQTVSTTGAVKDGTAITVTVGVPRDYALYQNYPNPFNPSTTIRFDLKEPSTVRLEIYDILGQRVYDENKGVMSAGRFSETFDMSRFASGVYLYRITAVGSNDEKFVSLKKMMLIK
jgi:hypothetical protein